MTPIKQHIANLTKPVSEYQALAFLIEDLEWERDVLLDAYIQVLAVEARQSIKRLNN